MESMKNEKEKNREFPHEFARTDTAKEISYKLLPVLEKIAADEFKVATVMWPDFDEDDEKDIDNSLRMIEAMVSGYLRRMKAMYVDYWKCVDKLLNCGSDEELDQAIDALLREK